MNADETHESPAHQATGEAPRGPRPTVTVKVFCAVGLVGVLLSAVFLVPSRTNPCMAGDICGFTLMYIFLATLFLCLGFLRSSGPNVAAEHGGMGVLAGFLIGCVHIWPTKGGREALFQLAFLFGSIPGAAFGIVIGILRSASADAAAANASAREREQPCEEEDKKPQ